MISNDPAPKAKVFVRAISPVRFFGRDKTPAGEEGRERGHTENEIRLIGQ